MRGMEEIQTIVSDAATRLEVLVGGLRDLISELDEHLPSDAELERVSDGESCPTVSMEVQCDVAEAADAVDEAIGKLRQASRHTRESVLAAWRERLATEQAEAKDAEAALAT